MCVRVAGYYWVLCCIGHRPVANLSLTIFSKKLGCWFGGVVEMMTKVRRWRLRRRRHKLVTPCVVTIYSARTFFFWRANILHTLRMATRMLRSFADSVICGLAHYTFRYYRSSSIIGGWCFFLVVVEVVVVEGLSRWCRRSGRKNNSEDWWDE